MNCEDGYIYGITIEYGGQQENLIGKCQFEHNARMIASYIIESLNATPIVRVVDLEKKKTIGAFQKEIKQLESESVFGEK